MVCSDTGIGGLLASACQQAANGPDRTTPDVTSQLAPRNELEGELGPVLEASEIAAAAYDDPKAE